MGGGCEGGWSPPKEFVGWSLGLIKYVHFCGIDIFEKGEGGRGGDRSWQCFLRRLRARDLDQLGIPEQEVRRPSFPGGQRPRWEGGGAYLPRSKLHSERSHLLWMYKEAVGFSESSCWNAVLQEVRAQ